VSVLGQSVLAPLRRSLLAALAASAEFTALCGSRAYDAVPQGVLYPYCTLSLAEDSGPLSTFGALGMEVVGRVQVYSQYEGSDELDAVLRAIAAAWHEQALAVVGWVMNLQRYEGAYALPDLEDEDGQLVRTKVGKLRTMLVAA
jgi:hypothetical protein